jgi:hypothetical protein
MPRTAQEMLDLYIEAEVAVLAGKSVRFNDGQTERWVTTEDLQWIQKGREQWQAKVNASSMRASNARTFGGLSYSTARLDGK